MLAVLLATLAATLFGAAAVLQQRAARSQARLVPPARGAGRRLAARLPGSPTWLTGTALAGVGFATHAAALQLGSLALVQPILTLTLPASLLLARARHQRRLNATDWTGVVLLCAGVALFLAVTAPSNGPPRGHAALLLATLATAALGLAFTGVGRAAGPRGRALLWGVAAAVAFGLTAALTKASTADLASGGMGGLFTDWHGWFLLPVAAAGVLLEQAAFAAATTVAAAMLPITLINPVAAALLGLTGWHEHLASGPAAILAATLAALTLAAVGVGVISRSTLLQPPPRRVR